MILTLTRSVADIHGFSFLVTRLVLGPTDQREVIIELANCCLHTESHGRSWFFVTRLVLWTH